MADLLNIFDVSCPASTPSTAPIEVQTVPAGVYYVSKVQIVIPDGHAGLTGIALAYGHQPVIPSNAGAFISGNDESYPYELGDYPPGVAWSVFLCNNDLQSHAWQVRWELNLLPTTPPVAAPATIAPAAIYAAGAPVTG